VQRLLLGRAPAAATMSAVNITNVAVLDNPTAFINPFQFEISYECLVPLDDGKACLALSPTALSSLLRGGGLGFCEVARCRVGFWNRVRTLDLAASGWIWHAAAPVAFPIRSRLRLSSLNGSVSMTMNIASHGWRNACIGHLTNRRNTLARSHVAHC
jgi:hypothetical protein